MNTLLISIVIGLFVAILFFNIYFRWQILKLYKRLVANHVEFEAKHVLNSKKMKEEILPRYPEHQGVFHDVVFYR